PGHSIRMRLFGSITFAVTGTEMPYISHSHCTCFPASSLPLLLVNQNLVVKFGLTKASNTSATGLRISIPVLVTGTCLSCRFRWLVSVSGSISCSFIWVSSDFAFCLFLRLYLANYKAVNPPLDAAQTATDSAFAKHAGHIGLVSLLLLRSLGCLVQIGGKPIERAFPEFPILFNPLRCLFERFGIKLHFVHAAITSSPQQPGLFENAKMFGNRGQRHRVGSCEIGHTSIAPRKVRQNLPAGWISQRRKSLVQRPRRIFNHLVKYLPELLQ